jgi:hypothetical protein
VSVVLVVACAVLAWRSRAVSVCRQRTQMEIILHAVAQGNDGDYGMPNSCQDTAVRVEDLVVS